MFCKKCGADLIIGGKFCQICGYPIEPVQQFSNTQPVWHFVLLSVFTLSFYNIYWFYRNWRHLKVNKNLDISPGWRTIGLFVPIYGLFLIYEQLKNIRDFSNEAGIERTYSVGVVFWSLIILNLLSILPEPFFLIGLLSVLPLAVVQDVLNLYWKKEQPGFIERTDFSNGQIALLLIGGIFWILILIGLSIPE